MKKKKMYRLEITETSVKEVCTGINLFTVMGALDFYKQRAHERIAQYTKKQELKQKKDKT